MPQLNPAPWLMIFLFTWLIYLTIMPGKVLNHTIPNTLVAEDPDLMEKTHWTWTWY